MWQVKVGHEVVEVEANYEAEAILFARYRLCDLYPRLWDIIMAKDDSDFEVKEIEE